jgi:hypothetical protein
VLSTSIVYSAEMTGPRPIHDVAIASVLTEKMEYKLVDAEREGFHRLCYETAKTALTAYEKQREREIERVRGNADANRG